jgi:Spy/CpxP family protein refolding chaperone
MKVSLLPACRYAAALALLLCAVPGPAGAQGFKWWQTERFQRELSLTPDQTSRIEEVFQSCLPELRQYKETLDREEHELSQMIDRAADEPLVMQQLDRVEAARGALSKSRTRMLLRIRRVLTVEQRVRFGVLHEEWDRERKQKSKLHK